MASRTRTPWTPLTPPFDAESGAQQIFVDHAKRLAKLERDEDITYEVEEAKLEFKTAARSCPAEERAMLLTAGLVLTDLANQRWRIRVRKKRVEVRPPEEMTDDAQAERARIRRQELVKRDAQLRETAVRRFVRSMEKRRLYQGKFVSIFSLMRDGRELASSLRAVRAGHAPGVLDRVIDPYLQFVDTDETCSFTGLRLMDIWRYFRHTWTNDYKSVPGRSMMFLVRDRAAEPHPVMGIGALSSPVVQIRERDVWLGWHPDTFVEHARSNPTASLARWLKQIVETALSEIYLDDLLANEVLTIRHLKEPDDAVIQRLLKKSAEELEKHRRFGKSQHSKSKQHKRSEKNWVKVAKTHLFCWKRTLMLAEFLRARMVLDQHFGSRPSRKGLVALLNASEGVRVVRRIVRKAKADRVGIAVADISVCGAVQPYNAILGGKLVSMLAASPEVALEYRRRYSTVESEIASSMAGHAILRPADLVFFGTTSLYGVGASQYNRVKIPCDRLGGSADEALRYLKLGRSKTFGTSQFSDETVKACETILSQTDGPRVNSIFGEGTSPRLRKIRGGLDALAFPSERLLRHGRTRIVYGVSLVRNARDYLLGIDKKPRYLVSMKDGPESTRQIAAWWRERWLQKRILSDAVLNKVEQHTLVLPIRHGARVPMPPKNRAQVLLFPDLM